MIRSPFPPHNGGMARNKAKDEKPPADRHKPRRMVGVREPVAVAVEAYAKENQTDLTEMVNQFLINQLKLIGRWPAQKGG